MIVECRFGGLDYNCSRMFREVKTQVGFCCVFNALPKKYLYRQKHPNHAIPTRYYEDNENPWHPEDGFASDKLFEDPYAFPRPITGEFHIE